MDEKQANFKFYVIANTSVLTNMPLVTIEEHNFDFNDETDKTTAVEYHTDSDELDEETLTVEEFQVGCYDFLMEVSVNEWGQRFCNAMVLTEEQFNLIKNHK